MDVLNLEWQSYPSRDRNVASLVNNYLRFQGLSVTSESIFQGFKMIDKYKPKLLFITNATGAPINFQIVKYAKSKGIKVLTLVSEGNFTETLIKDFVWGWNKDFKLYEDINLLWSNRTKKMSIDNFPQNKDKVKVSGSAGLDMYKIKEPIKKNSFLKKYGKEQYTRVIGVGCWDFGPFYVGDPRYNQTAETFNPEQFQRFKDDGVKFNKILIEAIKRNPDVLFLLKEHPGVNLGYFASGIEDCESLSNTLILKKESIIDCIECSDFWLTYESTTVIEAWLLGKQTCLLNPSGIDFPRANVYKGSPNFSTLEKLQKAIDVFYAFGNLPGFEGMDNERQDVLKEISEWHDGLNHVRIGNEIIKLINQNKSELENIIFDRALRKSKRIQYLINFLPYAYKYSTVANRLKNFDLKELNDFEDNLFQQQLKFYEKKGLDKKQLLKFNCE